jgi:hypothetical protein
VNTEQQRERILGLEQRIADELAYEPLTDDQMSDVIRSKVSDKRAKTMRRVAGRRL